MALSGTWSYTVTRDQIIRQAMLSDGVIGESETPTAQETTDCSDKLNMMVKQWMSTQDFAPGLKMWERQRGDLFLSTTKGIYQLGSTLSDNWAGGVAAGTALQNFLQCNTTAATAGGSAILTVGAANVGNFTLNDFVVVQVASGDIFSSTVQSIGATTVTLNAVIPATTSVNSGALVWNYTTKAQRPLVIRTAILRDSQNNDTPLNPLTLEDYEALPTKVQTTFLTDPTAYYYESQFAQGTNNQGPGILYLDCGAAYDVTKHIHVVYMRPVMDFNNPGDNPEYPQQWYLALCWGLAKQIASMFDAEWTKDMEENMATAIAMAREADAETTTTYFQPHAEEIAP